MNHVDEAGWMRLLRWVLGALLIWAAISKLANLNEFYGGLLAYRLPMPDSWQRLIAITLPWLELLTGLMLLANVWTRAALGWAVTLFLGFTIVTGEAWLRGLDISCGCFKLSVFGINASSAVFLESVQFAFFRALLLSAAAIYLLRSHINSWSRIIAQSAKRQSV